MFRAITTKRSLAFRVRHFRGMYMAETYICGKSAGPCRETRTSCHLVTPHGDAGVRNAHQTIARAHVRRGLPTPTSPPRSRAQSVLHPSPPPYPPIPSIPIPQSSIPLYLSVYLFTFVHKFLCLNYCIIFGKLHAT